MKEIKYIPSNYPSDLTNKEWAQIEPYFPLGNKSKWHKRSLVNAVLYVKDNGCKWRALPHDYPPHDTVWTFFRRTRDSGLWEKIMDALVKRTRESAGRKASPSYGIIDSQSVKTIAASEERGIDGGKKQKDESDIS
jgi:putative transposase